MRRGADGGAVEAIRLAYVNAPEGDTDSPSPNRMVASPSGG